MVVPNAIEEVVFTFLTVTRVTVSLSPSVSGESKPGLTKSSAPTLISRRASSAWTSGSVLDFVTFLPSTVTVTDLGMLMRSVRPERPSVVDREADSWALSARRPSSANASPTFVAVVQYSF